MHFLAALLARWTVRHPAMVSLTGLGLAGLCAAVVFSHNTFDSNVLNLLPADNPAVRGLKIYNNEFPQNRELAFLLTWDAPQPESEATREAFIALLRQEPWVERILDASPMETKAGRQTLHEIVVPLLFNLPEADFAAAMHDLSPGAIRARIDRLAAQTVAGSPKARFLLENDPLGLASRAARPAWETIEFSKDFTLTTPDGSGTIVPVITTQSDNSAEACRAMMAKVRGFMERAKKTLVRNRTGSAGTPHIGVTGRSAFVAEISESMKWDIITTSSVSLAAVTILFWIGFRRLLPLAGIALILALTALMAMAGGALLFDRLNIIAISFCSILFGLGDDFSLLLCQRYFHARGGGAAREAAIADSIRHGLPGILWVAVTTGIGFLALFFSGSRGFAQLGVLVALGVLLCALLMPVYLFLFLRKAPSGAAGTGPAGVLAHWSLASPGRVLRCAAAVFGVAALLAILPWRSLSFDISAASLQPRNTPASKTLALMMEKFPATSEPVLVVLPTPDTADLASLNAVMARMKAGGLIDGYSSPSALVLDPERQAANRRFAKRLDLEGSRRALAGAAAANGITPATFQKTLTLLDRLDRISSDSSPKSKPKSWSDFLASTSSWWFLLDRMVSPVSPAVVASIQTPRTITIAERQTITRLITAAVPDALVTGWSQALVGLIPWAQHELVFFGAFVTVAILGLLAVVYRNARLWLLHAVSLLAALAGTLATLKLFDLPINLLNVLAFPLMLGVGVDYGVHIILAVQAGGSRMDNLAGVLKPVALSGLTTATGFGALMLAQNPALAGLGAICAIGVLWCLLASLLIVAPGAAATLRRT